jgi:hypothetical protein
VRITGDVDPIAFLDALTGKLLTGKRLAGLLAALDEVGIRHMGSINWLQNGQRVFKEKLKYLSEQLFAIGPDGVWRTTRLNTGLFKRTDGLVYQFWGIATGRTTGPAP